MIQYNFTVLSIVDNTTLYPEIYLVSNIFHSNADAEFYFSFYLCIHVLFMYSCLIYVFMSYSLLIHLLISSLAVFETQVQASSNFAGTHTFLLALPMV